MHALRCEVTLAWGEAKPNGAQVELRFGQRDLALVDRTLVVSPSTLPGEKAPAKPHIVTFHIPDVIVDAALRSKRIQRETGAEVYWVQAFVELRPVDAKGKLGPRQGRTLNAKLSFGE